MLSDRAAQRPRLAPAAPITPFSCCWTGFNLGGRAARWDLFLRELSSDTEQAPTAASRPWTNPFAGASQRRAEIALRLKRLGP
jgi:hypothetical protein